MPQKLVLASTLMVGGVRAEGVRSAVLDAVGRDDAGGDAHAIRFAATLARGVLLIMRNRTDR